MELLGYNTTDDEGNEVSLNQNDLKRSLMRNSWKNFRETFKQQKNRKEVKLCNLPYEQKIFTVYFLLSPPLFLKEIQLAMRTLI